MKRSTRRVVAGVFLLLAAVSRLSGAAEEPVKSTHMVAMRDGTRLATVVHRPAGQKGPLPVIFMRGPYGKATSAMAKVFCDRGYTLVSQDVRGRFDSEGNDAVVFHHGGWGEKRDGHDSIRWIVQQDWCNGRVATRGGSALGITQNLLAPGAPDALRAQYVRVAFSNMYSQAAYQGGVWRASLIEHWLKANRFDPESLHMFLAHPRYDDFWAGFNPEAQASQANAPAIFWGGWYDIFVQGTINSFVTIQTQGGPRARGNCRLIIGPYAHGTFDQLVYPPNSRKPPAAGDAFRFFDYWLKGVDNGVAADRPVHYYVMGDPEDTGAPGNFWRSADSWPPPSVTVPFYFHADGRLSRTQPQTAGTKRTYRYDPNAPVPTVGGQNLNLPKGPMDQRDVESRDDVLLLTSEVLTEPVEVTGRVRATLFVSSDCPDTDFTVKLTDVFPDGRSMLVTDGILRARYRNSFEREDFLKPGATYELVIDLWSTSLVFNKGHRIRVALSSSNAPRFEPNPNTGGAFRADDEKRVATNTVHMSEAYPSSIILPVNPPP